MASKQGEAMDTTTDEEYKRQQRARMASYVVGQKDPNGYTITKVYARGDEYVVYEVGGLDPSESFKINVDTEIESDPYGLTERFEQIKEELNNFRAIIHKCAHDTSAKNRAAHAISSALQGETDNAKRILNTIIEQINKEYIERITGKITYLSASLGVITLFSMVSVALYLIRSTEWARHNMELVNMIYSITFAGYGGLLSITTKLNELFFERGLSKLHYVAYGLQRISYSALGGIFMYLIIKSKIVFGFLVENSNNMYGILALCVVAGFSEKLVPSTIHKLESQSESGHPQ
jgi:hypothetical protein